jgi:cell division septal protein FtsQ
MHPRSNVSASLYKRRRASLIKKLWAYFIFVLFFISLGILGLTTEEVRIKDITVSGNISVPAEDITRIVKDEMGKVYLWIIPTDNLLLLRRKEIKNDILSNIEKIGKTTILIKAIDKIEIVVKERESKNLWCKGTPISPKDCYFMDSDGFIFEEAPKFSEGAFPEYFGLIMVDNPVGQSYFKDNFRNIYGLYSGLKNMSFQPKYFNALSEDEYEVYIFGGGKILINNKKDFESQLINLQALVDSNYLKTTSDGLKKIKYIDLRFGNKINFELNK